MILSNRFVQRSILPGFSLSLGFTIFYLSLIVLIPLSMIFFKASSMGFKEFMGVITAPRTLAAYKLSFTTAFLSALINAVFGLIVAWVLVRYSFPGKRIVDALVDFPLALPTAVAGIALTELYTPTGWVGQYLGVLGIKAAFTPLGITIALTFIGLPFVVRTIQPVLEDMDPQIEEAAASLGANRWQTVSKIILPVIFPALLTGVTLAFARAIGEYGSVIFIAGNMPMKTEIVPLLIMTKLEQYDYTGATAIAIGMLVISFVLLATANFFQWLTSRNLGKA
ncbi:MAG: sulfate ABC transporter permease subunit CysT [Candidatus Omnitrophica bacterium]|nr:sulfate ABC transporter permease subunit CysT [Candidatus Omnitrophota bacterium]